MKARVMSFSISANPFLADENIKSQVKFIGDFVVHMIIESAMKFKSFTHGYKEGWHS